MADRPAGDDRRSRRTRTALREALVALITERGWDDIAVQDVCERANIGRSTFYIHYPNKEALLAGSLEDLRAFLRQHAGAGRMQRRERLAFLRGLIAHAFEQRRLFRALMGRRSGYVVQQRFRDMVLRLVEDELPRTIALREARARWIAAAIVDLLGWWVDQRDPVDPDSLAATIERWSAPALESA